MSRVRWILAVAAVVLVVAGGVIAGRLDDGLVRTTTVVDGVPLTLVRTADAVPRPGAVVVHGFAGSARLMLPFADTLARSGYVVVLPDLRGHGASGRPLRPDAVETELESDVDTAVRFLRAQPQTAPDRTVLIGHSMGATAVAGYAADHPDIVSTVAISLSRAPQRLPRNVLLLYGGLEFPAFALAAQRALELPDPTGTYTTGHTYGDPAAGTARRAEAVPAVEHITILFSTTTHHRMLDWLGQSAHPSAPQGTVAPSRRLIPAGLLWLGLLIGFIPLAGWPVRPATGPDRDPDWHRLGRGAVAGAVAGAVVGVFLPDSPFGLGIGGYTAVVFLAFGLAALAFGDPGRLRPTRPAGRELATGFGLIGYAAAVIAVPIQAGLTGAALHPSRLVPLLAIALATWVALLATERLGRTWLGQATVLAVVAALLVALPVVGAGPGFALLVSPLLVALLAIGAGLAAVLRRSGAPPWLRAGVGAAVLAWPIATSLPVVV